MTAAYGSSSADGTWTQRDSFVAIEVGTILALRSMMLPETPTGIVEKLEEFERRLPTQTVRSEEQISTQHFSTPLARSEEHTSELQSLMRNSYAVFCLKKN